MSVYMYIYFRPKGLKAWSPGIRPKSDTPKITTS